MPVALVLIFGVVVLAVCLIGILWAAVVFLLPFYAFTGALVYLIWRSKHKEAELREFVEREAEKERRFNEQETRAWRNAVTNEQRSSPRREKALRSFDRTRDPSQK